MRGLTPRAARRTPAAEQGPEDGATPLAPLRKRRQEMGPNGKRARAADEVARLQRRENP
jgi:hypothetical protein